MSQKLFYHQYVSKKSKQVPLPWIYRLLHQLEEHRYTAIEQLLEGKIYTHCLDVGCGSGDFLYTNQVKFQQVTGIDIVPQLISQVRRKKFDIPAAFYSHDGGQVKMPFKKNSFDLVISIATLQYMYDLELFFDEVFRTLQPDGLFIFEVPNFLVVWRRFQLAMGSFPSTSQFQEQWDGGVVHYFTEDRLRAFCHRHKFIIRTITCSGILSILRKPFPSILGANLIFVCQKPH